MQRLPTGPGAQTPASSFVFLWIAANELPLRDELVPFLIARSGRALDAFLRWVASRRPLEWLLNVVRYTVMSTTVREEWARRFAPTEDSEVEARTEEFLHLLLKQRPKFRQAVAKEEVEKGIERGRLVEARAALRHVLAQRRLALTAHAEALIDACEDVATLRRWLDQSLTAATAADALK